MRPSLRLFFSSLGACLLAAWLGVTLAAEQIWLAGFITVLSGWVVLSWSTAARAEAWLLGLLVVGYVIGNRGFAQIAPASAGPLFPGELGLVGAGSLVLFRGALRRESPVRRDALNAVLLLWLGLGAGRLALDIRVHGMTALRDFATVYYVLYFFAAQTIAGHLSSRRILRGALVVAFAVLPFTAVLAQAFPEFFLTRFTLRGAPLIFYKDDLLATFLFSGFILFVPKRRLAPRADWWRWLLALAALALGFLELSRAAMVGLAVALTGLAVARLWQPLRGVLAAGALALLLTAGYSVFQHADVTQTKIYGVYEHLLAITDVSGTRQYSNLASLDSGDNNRFRLVWWRTLSQEVLSQAPLFGLGFGHDLARGFVQEYYAGVGDEFVIRSPHSIVFTALGRMGLAGVAVLLVIMIVLAVESLRAAKRTATGRLDEEAVTLYAIVWLILISACFGVVLEGPMAAIPFWVILGLAHHLAQQAESPAPPDAAPEPDPAHSLPDRGRFPFVPASLHAPQGRRADKA